MLFLVSAFFCCFVGKGACYLGFVLFYILTVGMLLKFRVLISLTMKNQMLSKKEIEDLLRRGAYGAIMDEDDAGSK